MKKNLLMAALAGDPVTADKALEAALSEGAAPVQVVARPGLVTPFFSAEPVTDFAGATACDHDAYARFCRGLLDRGVYPPPSQYEAWFVSLAHDEAAIDHTCEAAADVLAEALTD